MKQHQHWIATCDERRAFLFSCRRIPPGRWHVDQRKAIESRWEHYHQEHRPSALGRGPTASAAQHFASIGHEPEEEHRRFAREVREWLSNAVRELGIEHVHVFAASRFLGLLRDELGDLSKSADLHEAELTRLPLPDLIAHSAVVRVLNAPTAVKSTARS